MPRLERNDNGRFGRLDGGQIKALVAALEDAFDDVDAFDDMLLYYRSLNRKRISTKTSLHGIIRDVVNEDERTSNTAELLQAALNAYPTHIALLEFAEQFGLSPVPTRQLQRLIRAAKSPLDVEEWLNRIDKLVPQVCMIDVPVPGNPSEPGTGFLLGPDLVMTNYHVIEKVLRGQVRPERVRLLFDYRRLTNAEVISSAPYHLAENEWLVDYSEYSPLDEVADTQGAIPREDQLDYALLRIAGAPGNDEALGKKQPRKWIELPSQEPKFERNTAIYILQHPRGLPLQLGNDGVSIISWSASRVRYQTNTAPGSSGSPCFDGQWQLVALHNSGDPDYSQFHNPEYNQGVPIWTIRNLLERRNKLSLLGG